MITSGVQRTAPPQSAAEYPSAGESNTPYESGQVRQLNAQLVALAQRDPDAFKEALSQAFGGKADSATLDAMLAQARQGNLTLPAVQFVDAGTLGPNAMGAYSAENGGTIFLDRRLLSNPEQLQAVFTEEVGHHLDMMLGGSDAEGDEGAIFAQSLLGEPPSPDELTELRSENDSGFVLVDGRRLLVEFSMDEAAAGKDDTEVTSNTDNTSNTNSGAPSHENGNSDSDKNGGMQGNAPTGNKPGTDETLDDIDTAKSLTDTAADSADAANENLDRSPDRQSNSTGLRGGLAYAAGAFGKAIGALGTVLGFSKGYERELGAGGSQADAVREGFREVALDVDDGIISGAGLTGGAVVTGSIMTATPAGPVGTVVGAAAGGLAGAKAADAIYDESALDNGFDHGVNYVFDTIENWQHRD